MKFLKDNLFLVVTLATVIVAAAVLMVLAQSAQSDADKYAQLRQNDSREISSLTKDPRVNEAVVQSARDRVEKMKNASKNVVDTVATRNVDEYSILALTRPNQKKELAFPIDRARYSAGSLRRVFLDQYREVVLAMLKDINPTEPATDEELRTVLSPKDGSTGAAAPAPPATAARIRSSDGTPAAASTSPASQPVRTAEEIARDELKLVRASAGSIYANETSLAQGLSGQQPDDQDLWQAQASLWVQKDILDAIRKTNEQAHARAAAAPAGPDGRPVGVMASGVKRLVKMNYRGYLVKKSVAGGGGAATSMFKYLPLMGITTQAQPVAVLTKRVTSKLYDVVHYDFTVILPNSQLLPLYRNLLASNYHTILDVQIRQAGAQAGAGDPQADRYYYGPDPVVEATITGELLLLADFTRGKLEADKLMRWDTLARKWVEGEPYMPRAFLEQLKAEDPTILRKEDEDRLAQSGGPDTGGGGAAAGGGAGAGGMTNPPIR